MKAILNTEQKSYEQRCFLITKMGNRKIFNNRGVNGFINCDVSI